MICSATSTHLPNLRFTLLLLRVQLLLLLSRRRIALQHRPTQQLPQLRLQSLKSRLKKLRRKSILSELIQPAASEKAEPAPAPKAEPKELQSEAINPFDQAFSRPIATPDAGGFEGPKDNTIFGNFHASNNIRPASDVFATLNPQAGNGNDSGLWTANQHNGAPEAKGQGAAEAKAEDEKPRFEYGIPAFLRKKN